MATRPDCLGDEILQGLSDISRIHFVQIELGLQTSNENTGRLINRCYTNQDYIDVVTRIRKTAPQVHIVTHLIFGLPNETEEDMLNSVKFVVEQNCHTSTMIDSVENTRLAQMYEAGQYQPLTKEQYFVLLQKALPLLPDNCVVYRLTGDLPKRLLLAPDWTTDKKHILNQLRSLL